MTISPDEARVFDALGCLVICLDRRLNVRFVNRSGLALLGYASRQELDGRPWTALLDDATRTDLHPALGESAPAPTSMNLIEAALRTRDGLMRPFVLNFDVRPGDRHDAMPIVVLGFDAPPSTAGRCIRRADDKARRVSSNVAHVAAPPDARDALTGLPDRAILLRMLSERLFAARRQDKEVTLLYVSVEELATFDSLTAEHVVIEMAARINQALRETDALVRIDRDVFGVILGPHDTAIDGDIDDVAQRVLAAINTPLNVAGGTLRAVAAIGVTACSGASGVSEAPADLLDNAARACDQARVDGGNCYFRFDPATASRATQRRSVLLQLHQAIDNGELVLHYQPQLSLTSGAVVGLEALVRWQHPQRGLLPPGEFVPFAEQSSHIVDLGKWVLDAACRQMRAWLDDGLPAIKVAINLAARHFHVAGLPATIAETLAAHRIDARSLELEITEGAMMHDVAAAIRATRQLKAIGVRLSLDDFGTGYSSLAYLSRFPIDVVKIDQSFVADITSNPTNAAIAQATIAMSHKLGKIVLAEGVENEEQMLYLKRCECDEMQGYHFSRPLAADDAARLLRQGTTMPMRGDDANAVLFVDDEAHILAAIRRVLRREGYRLLVASSADEAFSLLATHNVQVIVSDQQMPQMNGTEFLERAKGLYPRTVRMVLSGYSDIAAVTDAINKGAVYRFLQKPWIDEVLKNEIAGALRHWRELHAPRSAP
jgi:diguanylate cyclase (GGDEF)-like protein